MTHTPKIAGANSRPALGFSAAPISSRRSIRLWLSFYPLDVVSTTGPIYECHVCRAPGDTHIAGYRVAGVDLMLPNRFVYAYRDRGKPLGICNICFEAGRFDGFTADEIAYFRHEFAQTDGTTNI